MKYCCEHFKFRHNGKSTMGLNIRVIKLSEKYIEESKRRGVSIRKNELYNFIISEGYEEILTNKGQIAFITYCPFCGKKLAKFYSKEEYINEENHIW